MDIEISVWTYISIVISHRIQVVRDAAMPDDTRQAAENGYRYGAR